MGRVKKKYLDKEGDWQTTFCALSIILVAFFVMLCSYATLEKGKIIEVKRSFRGALQIFSGGVLFDSGEGIVVPSPDTYGLMQDKVAAPIHQLLKGKGLEEEIVLKSTHDFVTLTMLDTVLFEPDSAVIADSAKPFLKKLANILGDLEAPVRVEGHTDDQTINRKKFENNWELSSMRAINILRYLKAQGKIPADRISATGFAQYRPFVPNKTAEDRRRNRRVEIIIPLVQEFFENRDSIIRKVPPSFKVWDLKG